MFIKSLTIATGDGTVIRNIPFHVGLNLIIDETPVTSGKETGNNVGKTTVLKLVDFCLGASAKGVYTDPENKRNEYEIVKAYLIAQRVVITLVLKDDLRQADSREVVIERNFLGRKDRIQRINGKNVTDDAFDAALTALVAPAGHTGKPTYRQLIAHNIRYSDLSVTNTIKHLDAFTRDDEYETLYLFLLGCSHEQGDRKQELRTAIDLEERFKRRIESRQTRSAYEAALAIVVIEITELERQKTALNLNPSFENNLNELNAIKYKINVAASDIGRLETRRSIIIEAQDEMRAGASSIDLAQLRHIYEQATSLISNVQRTFEELYAFHNRMLVEKMNFIASELPKIEAELSKQRSSLKALLSQEADLSGRIVKGDSFIVLERIIADLNARYQTRGEYEGILEQIKESDNKLSILKRELTGIDDVLFSESFSDKIKTQIFKFNKHFSSVANKLYGEKYALKVDQREWRGRKLYEFTSFNTNFSSGKKQGEISCFDIAYTLFADEERLPCMHFLLSDKKELMHDNQLIAIAKLVHDEGLQFVASILKDKLPAELNKPEYIIVRLSPHDKLFRIESGIPHQ